MDLSLLQYDTYEKAVSPVAFFDEALEEWLDSFLFYEPLCEELQPILNVSNKQPVAGPSTTLAVNYEHALNGFNKDHMYAVCAPNDVDMASDE
ncbi:hypothetical protein NDU88_005124 [Pleurodeles waltl]|uniref:Uncharacterized protein n=1 Tax=Pleurodeles waltl TaxID=8319 RepID=A0AAV7W9U7_PLEWA|nr:hypothetical protein NDU88_005124 [Pleurodeles waltl]